MSRIPGSTAASLKCARGWLPSVTSIICEMQLLLVPSKRQWTQRSIHDEALVARLRFSAISCTICIWTPYLSASTVPPRPAQSTFTVG